MAASVVWSMSCGRAVLQRGSITLFLGVVPYSDLIRIGTDTQKQQSFKHSFVRSEKKRERQRVLLTWSLLIVVDIGVLSGIERGTNLISQLFGSVSRTKWTALHGGGRVQTELQRYECVMVIGRRVSIAVRASRS